jgi:hypothetical protein
MIDLQLGRIAELYAVGQYTREVYDRKTADLLIERDSLDVVPACIPLAIQRQRIQSVVDHWREMTGDERKRMLQLISAKFAPTMLTAG